MLVLNRRPGESIIIEPGVHVTVLSVNDRRVWISFEASGRVPPVRVSATMLSAEDARLEIGPLAGVEFDGDEVRISTGEGDHPANGVHATLALDRRVGEGVRIGGVTVHLASLSKGNPCIAFGGPVIGEELRITVIRPAGNYVRLGVDAPARRVYRKELWEAVQSEHAAATRPPLAAATNGTEPVTA